MEMMVDIETTGTRPDRTAIIQLSAVKFSLEDRDYHGVFNTYLPIPPNRHWQEDTRSWWMKDKKEHLNEIIFNACPLQKIPDELNRFREFINEWPVRFWASPIHFDYPFVVSYFYDHGLSLPIHYRDTVDLLSWAEGLLKAKDVPMFRPKDLEFEGRPHDAVDDCVHQVKYVFEVLKRTE